MLHLPHSPAPYLVGLFTLWVMFLAYVVLIRIWRGNRKQRGAVPSRYLNPPGVPTSAQVMKAQQISVEFAFNMSKIKTQLATTSAQLSHFASVYRRSMPQIGWLAHDPPRWTFPTWRVTRRPFDWRND